MMKREAELDLRESADKLLKTMENKDVSANNFTQFLSHESNRPDVKTQRYDRQLRLWQNLGQKRLNKASIAIWDSGATSTQIVKNLALAGVCRINMFDEEKVRQSDIGNNFFLDQSSLGKYRVEESRKYLDELNPSTFIDNSRDNVIGEYGFDYDFCDSMQSHELDVLIAVRMTSSDESNIRHICWRHNVPSIYVETCGLVAKIKVEIIELGLIETHSDSLVDLRLDCPFPEMSEFVNSFEMQKMDNLDHAHIPAVVILIQFLERFKSEHDGKLPQNSNQRDKLKRMILAEKRSIDEDNFDEAVEIIWKACQETKVPMHIEKLFMDDHCKKLPKIATQFWFLVRCLKEFVTQDPMHHLPLSGVLPDMKSDTKNYIKMQSIYRQKAQQDLESFRIILEKMKKSLDEEEDKKDEGEQESESEDEDDDVVDERSWDVSEITDEEIEIFVKNSAHLRLTRLNENTTDDLINKFSIESESDNDDFTTTWYIAFDALEFYRDRHEGRYPGTETGKEAEDFETLLNIALRVLAEIGWPESKEAPPKLTKAIQEIVRSGGSELPHISSLVGGIVSQEAIKLLTKQYVPLNKTFIFDGYHSTTGVF